MTGKEALIQLSKTCKALELEFGNLKIDKIDNEALQTLREIVQKYDKYKRAFEILKEVLVIPEDDDIDWCDKDINYYKLKFTKRLINGNEKELLEELMRDAKD